MNLHFLNAFASSSALEAFTRHTAGAIIASVWQGLILAAAIGLCLQFVPRTPAKLRFTIWAVAFIVLAGLPLVNELLADHFAANAARSNAPHLQVDARWSYALAAMWLAALVVRLAYFAFQAAKLRSLWNSAVPVSTELLPELPLGKVELCISTELDRPSVIGFFSPRILVPAWLFEQLTPGELHQIVLHELEHLRRRDDWINLLQKIGLVLFPLNPTLFWIDRRLATERELACDDGVLSRTHAPRAYATCLTSLAERRLEHAGNNRLTALALGAVGAIRHSDFSRRVESILGWRPALNPAPARAVAALLVTGVFGGAMALTRAPQLVSFTATPQPQPVAALQSDPAVQSVAVRTNLTPTAKFENAVFHPQAAAGNHPSLQPKPHSVKLKAKSKPRPATPAVQADAAYSETIQRQNRRMTVLASWQQSIPQPVLVTLPDGRTFLATYAPGPNQPGWLFIQL